MGGGKAPGAEIHWTVNKKPNFMPVQGTNHLTLGKTFKDYSFLIV
jgi:hypothetical protein